MYIQRIKEFQLYAYVAGRQNHKCANFTLLFCRGRHGIILKCVAHVQYVYILPFDQLNCYFVMWSFPCRRVC